MRPKSGYYDPAACDIATFNTLLRQTTSVAGWPHAAAAEKNIPIYDMTVLRPALGDQGARRAVMAEWAQVLMRGPGVLALQGAYADTTVLDAELAQNMGAKTFTTALDAMHARQRP